MGALVRPWLGAALAAAVCVLGGAALAQKPAAHPPAAAPPAPPAPAPAALPLQPGQPIPPAELEAFVDGFAAEAMARDHIAGAAVTVVQDGQVVLQKGYGADRLSPARPVDPDRTLFRLGEVTQLFTWIALAREIEAGHIRLDAPVNVYLPQKDQIRDQGYRQPIRVRNLMNHTAGFEDRSLGQLIERDPDRIRPLDVYLAQERPHRVREPGVLPTATGYGPALAGEALVQVTGRTLQSLVDGEIVQPLGLRRTTLREPYPARAGLPAPMDPALASDLSQGFQWTGGGFRALPTEFMTQAAPASAASASAADMGRFMLAILGDGTYGGATVYSPAIAREFRTPLDRPTPTGAAFDYGFMERPLPGGFAGYGHTGRTLGFHADLTVAPALGLGVFVAANTDTGRGLVAGLPAAVVQRFYAGPRALPPTPSPWLRENAGAFAGTYMTTARAYAGLERFADLLRDHSRVRVTGGGLLLTTGATGAQLWTPDPAASTDARFVTFHQADGPAVITFEMRDGRAARWFAPSGRYVYERSGPLQNPWLLAALAAAAGLASIGALAGLFLRDRRESRQSSAQGRADAAQLSGSVLWLVSLACFAVWAAGSTDPAARIFGWPGPWLLIASSSAVVASVLTALCLVMLPAVWRGGRRLDSWTAWRKARFTVATVLFALFAVLLGLWGALEPWSR